MQRRGYSSVGLSFSNFNDYVVMAENRCCKLFGSVLVLVECSPIEPCRGGEKRTEILNDAPDRMSRISREWTPQVSFLLRTQS